MSIPVGQIFSALDPKLIVVIVVLWVLSAALKPDKRKRRSSNPNRGRSTRRSARQPRRGRRSAGQTSAARALADPTPTSQKAVGASSHGPQLIAPDDLAGQVAGATLRAAGQGDEESPWTVGAEGEEITARRLAELGEGWNVVHSVPVGTNGADLDHLVIGPCGVFVLNTKMRPGADVKVIDNGIRVAGQWERYLHTSRHEADRVRSVLSKHNLDVPVQPAIVFVGIKSLSVGPSRPDVAVLSIEDVVWWLRGRTPTVSPDEVDAVFAIARRRATWQ